MTSGGETAGRASDFFPFRPPVLAGLLLVLCFFGINRDLWTPDEPREAEISREMWVAPGVVPTLNDEVFIEKPPLYYWVVATVFQVTGGASVWAARSVSIVSSLLTLLLVYFWGRREFSPRVGALAAIGLVTSVQFMISSHWVLIDPLLMLFMSAATWAAWELLARGGGLSEVLVLYAALVLALWTKGLIGPILLGCGIVAYVAWMRQPRLLWRLRPLLGATTLALATLAFAALVYLQAGPAAVREWFWVNHVMRFVSPVGTGHVQPFYYYVIAIPTAVFPWWVPFANLFRRRQWRDPESSNRAFRTFLAALCVGMTLILSAASTKRSIYLLPMLPALALLIAAQADDWIRRFASGAASAWPWWFQAGLTLAFAAALPLIGMAYVRELDTLAIGMLAAVAAVALGVGFLRREKGGRGVAAICASGVLAFFLLFLVAMHFGGPDKNMTEFVEWVDGQLPAGDKVFGYGTLDETFDGIIPFVTGRRVVRLEADDIDRLAPSRIVVQDKEGGTTTPDLPPGYSLLRERNFGPGRYFAIWSRDP